MLRVEIGERPSAPQAERLAETIPCRSGLTPGGGRTSLLEQRFETFEVELARLETEPVAGRAALDPIAAEQRPQPRDIRVERALRAFRCPRAPQAVDQSIAGDDLVPAQQQRRQQRPLLRPAKRQRPAIDPDLDRAEDQEVHTSDLSTSA